jgi:hypothetical protein
MKQPFLWVSPISKNVTRAVIEYCEEKKTRIGFIPSRRQVEYDGGYTGFTTKSLAEYVKSSTDKCPIYRDHSGPNQGEVADAGFKSLIEDAKFFDGIHVDPFYKRSFEDGVNYTIDIIKAVQSFNPNVTFEIGTEEAICKISPEMLDSLLGQLLCELGYKSFKQIDFAVIQFGTRLQGGENIGTYKEEELQKAVEICRKWGVLSKSHNTDYQTANYIYSIRKQGVDAINIAPEFGTLETKVIIEQLKPDEFEKFYKLCLESKKWVKWVNQDFNPEKDKRKLVEICGHYVFRDQEFRGIYESCFKQSPYSNYEIDEITGQIITAVKNRLDEILFVK